jgi:hypothetical protein
MIRPNAGLWQDTGRVGPLTIGEPRHGCRSQRRHQRRGRRQAGMGPTVDGSRSASGDGAGRQTLHCAHAGDRRCRPCIPGGSALPCRPTCARPRLSFTRLIVPGRGRRGANDNIPMLKSLRKHSFLIEDVEEGFGTLRQFAAPQGASAAGGQTVRGGQAVFTAARDQLRHWRRSGFAAHPIPRHEQKR